MKEKLLYITLIFICSYAADMGAQSCKGIKEYDWDAKLEALGFLDVNFWEPSIQFFLVYATDNNFTGRALYNSKLTRPWLHPRAAWMLYRAQEYLQEEYPELSLFIFDAARPFQVQYIMYEWAKCNKREYYVADPAKGGGLHNFGLAVDVTIIDEDGDFLPMGTDFDHFGPEANIDREDELLKNHKITQEEYDNRRLLRRIMTRAGFLTVKSEWWHFNACQREEAQEKYELIH